MSNALPSCRICGHPAKPVSVVLVGDSLRRHHWIVQCSYDGAHRTTPAESVREAIALWNRTTPSENARIEAVRPRADRNSVFDQSPPQGGGRRDRQVAESNGQRARGVLG